MEVTRDVILDLLPLYLAEEASPDSRALVDDFLARDPDLERLARQWRVKLPGPPPAPLRPEAQALAYSQAQKQLAIRTVGLALVISITVIALIALTGALFLVPRM